MKYVFFTCAVLLAGQVPVSGRTVGSHVQNWFSGAISWSRKELQKRRILVSTPLTQNVASWVKTGNISPRAEVPAKAYAPADEKTAEEAETISQSDREAVRRLLEE